MFRTLALTLFITFCSLAPAQETPDGTDLLKKVAATYSQLQTYQFQADVSTRVSSDGSLQQLAGASLSLVSARGDKLRLDVQAAGTASTAVVNGGRAYQSAAIPASNPLLLVVNSVEDDTYGTLSHGRLLALLTTRFYRLAAKGTPAKVIREETIEANHGRAKCWVLQVSPSETYWIDSARLLAVKALFKLNAAPLEYETTLTWRGLHTNESVKETWFALEAPRPIKPAMVASSRPITPAPTPSAKASYRSLKQIKVE